MKCRLMRSVTLAATLITICSLAGGANAAISLNFTDEIGGLTLTSSGTYNLTGASAVPHRYSGIASGSKAFAINTPTIDIIGFDTYLPDGSDTFYDLTLLSGTVSGFTSNFTNNPSSFSDAPSTAFFFIDESPYLQIVFNGTNLLGDAAGSAVWSGQTIASAGLTDGYLATYLINGTSEQLTISVNRAAVPEPSSLLLLGSGALALFTRRRRALASE